MRLKYLVVLLGLFCLSILSCSSEGGQESVDVADVGTSDFVDGFQETDAVADCVSCEDSADEVSPVDVDGLDGFLPDLNDVPDSTDVEDDWEDSLSDSLSDSVEVDSDVPPVEDVLDVEDNSVLEPPAPVLNEIGCFGDDFIELTNCSAESSADLSGFVLSDGSGSSHNYTIPSGTILGPLERRVFVKESNVTAGFPFGIQCGADSVRLLDPEAETVDVVDLPLVMKGNSYSRIPDGTGPWEESTPTPWQENLPEPGLEGILFDPMQVISIDLELPESSIASLWVEPDVYVSGVFSMVSGSMEQMPIPVGVRLKGGTGTFQTLDEKPSLKLKFNFIVDDQRFLGLKKLTLNNMVQDASMLREVLSYRLFQAFGVPCARTGYARLTINGEPYGVYLVLEAYDDVSMSRFFATILHLYEGDSGVDVLPSHVSSFDIDEGNESNTADLSMLAIVVSNATDEAWVSTVEEVADLSEFIRMWAVEHYVAHWDGYSVAVNNYYLHSNDDKYFSMLPSGTDQSFMESTDFHEGTGHLFTRCMAIPECRTRYDQALADLIPVVDSLDLGAYVVSLSEGLSPWMADDPRMPYTMEDSATAVAQTLEFLVQRRTELEQALTGWLIP